MTTNESDLIRVANGELLTIELYQRALGDAGIVSRVVGENLEAGLGTALPGSIELWVRHTDVERAKAAINLAQAAHGRGAHEHPAHPHPTSDRKPDRPVTHGAHTHYNPDPRS